MKSKLLLVLALLLSVSSFVMAQEVNFTILVSNFSTMLTTECGGTTPIPDGTVGYIYNAETGLMLEVGPVGSAYPHYNINSFTMNGGAFGMDGFFFVENALQNTHGCFATQMPESFYLVIDGPIVGGQHAHWVSAPFSVSACGVQIEVEVFEWTCTTVIDEVPCEPTPFVDFAPNPSVGPQMPIQAVCATVCPGVDLPICVGPLPLPDRIPHVFVEPGCNPANTPCNDPDCPPAIGFLYNPTAWVWTMRGDAYFYCNVITMPQTASEGGCVCIHFDFIEPAEMGEVAAVPMDNAVKLTWNTVSETNIDQFIIARDGSDIGSVDASNNASGAEYSYTDETAVNGTTYSYTLITVGFDGARAEVGHVSATPSELAAVVTEYALHQNFPNPFNPTTSIRFDLVDNNFVTLKVYNATGQEVATLVNGERSKGVNFVNFDANNLTSGLYFYTIKVGNVYSSTKKMLLVK